MVSTRSWSSGGMLLGSNNQPVCVQWVPTLVSAWFHSVLIAAFSGSCYDSILQMSKLMTREVTALAQDHTGRGTLNIKQMKLNLQGPHLHRPCWVPESLCMRHGGATRLQWGSISGKLPKDNSEEKIKIYKSPDLWFYFLYFPQNYSLCSQFYILKEGLPKL